MKKVVVISSTPRVGGNSEVLAREFARGAEESGNSVEFIFKRLQFEILHRLLCLSQDG